MAADTPHPAELRVVDAMLLHKFQQQRHRAQRRRWKIVHHEARAPGAKCIERALTRTGGRAKDELIGFAEKARALKQAIFVCRHTRDFSQTYWT